MINGMGITIGRSKNPNAERIINDTRRDRESESKSKRDSEIKKSNHDVARPSVMRLFSHPKTFIDKSMKREMIHESVRGIFFRVSVRKNVAIAILAMAYCMSGTEETV